MSACACMGPRVGHRYCPCREKAGEREIPPGYWDVLQAALKSYPLLPDDDKSGDPPPLA